MRNGQLPQRNLGGKMKKAMTARTRKKFSVRKAGSGLPTGYSISREQWIVKVLSMLTRLTLGIMALSRGAIIWQGEDSGPECGRGLLQKQKWVGWNLRLARA